MHFKTLTKTAEHFISDNAPAILTGVGVIGTIATGVLSVRAGFRSKSKLDHAQTEKDVTEGIATPLTKTETVKSVWMEFVPPLCVGAISVTSIVMAQRMNVKRAAALAAAYAIGNEKFADYRDKVEEKLGINKATAIKDEVAQDKVTNNPPIDKQIIIASGDVLFMDSIGGRYFRSTVEALRQAENELNAKMLYDMRATLSEFYEMIGLPQTVFSDEVGWNSDKLMKLEFSATMTDKMEPCIVMDFQIGPKSNYGVAGF